MKHYLIILMAVFITIIAQMLLKQGATTSKKTLASLYLNFHTLFGYALLVISTIAMVYALKGIDMKEVIFILPLVYIFVPFMGIVFFKEKLEHKQIIGIFLIFIGIIVFNADKLMN